MNTIFGNFLERTIPNLKNAIINLTIGGNNAEMNLEDFKAVMVSEPTYKVYRALLTQTGGTAPVATILENTLGTIQWSYITAGVYSGTLTGAFPINKYFAPVPIDGFDCLANNGGGGSPYFYNRTNDDTILLSSGADDQLSNTPIEIRVYN
jgi:hypothetical protein